VTKHRHRFFVAKLDEQSYRPLLDAEYEVQIIGDDGQTQQCAYIGASSNDVIALVDVHNGRLPVVNHGIPTAVIEAARRRVSGSGEYVDEHGEVVEPSFFRGFGNSRGMSNLREC
jgi:hypothetical protein